MKDPVIREGLAFPRAPGSNSEAALRLAIDRHGAHADSGGESVWLYPTALMGQDPVAQPAPALADAHCPLALNSSLHSDRQDWPTAPKQPTSLRYPVQNVIWPVWPIPPRHFLNVRGEWMGSVTGVSATNQTASEQRATARSQSETELESTPGRHKDPCSVPTLSRCECL